MNWTPELIVNLVSAIGSTLTALGALAALVFTVWTNYKERASTHRQFLYEKQFEAYAAIIRPLNTWCNLGLHILLQAPSEEPLSSEIRLRLFQEGDAPRQEFLSEYDNWVVSLPISVQSEVTDYFGLWNALCGADNRASPDNPYDELNMARFEILAAMRDTLGVEPLTKNTMRLVGSDEYESYKHEQGHG